MLSAGNLRVFHFPLIITHISLLFFICVASYIALSEKETKTTIFTVGLQNFQSDKLILECFAFGDLLGGCLGYLMYIVYGLHCAPERLLRHSKMMTCESEVTVQSI